MKYRISFYADSSNYQNKQFTFNVNGHADALACLQRFRSKGNSIRAAFIQSLANGRVLQSQRIA